MTHITEIQNYLTSPLNLLSRAFYRFVNAITEARMAQAARFVHSELMKRKEYHDTYKTLSRMSDRELHDIGITRGMIHEVALGEYQKDYR